MDRRRYLELLATLSIAGIAGCSGEDEPDYQTTAPDQGNADGNGNATTDTTGTPEDDGEAESTPTSEPELALTGQSFEKVEGDYSTDAAMTGTIANQGETIAGYVEATATFYDTDGAVVDTTTTNLLDLESGETWELWAPYLGDASDAADGELEASYKPGSTATQPSEVELTDHSLEEPKDEYSGPRVVGKAQNNGDDLRYLEARAKFYAENGNVLASGIDNITELGGGDTWKFEITYSGYNSDWESRVNKHKVTLST